MLGYKARGLEQLSNYGLSVLKHKSVNAFSFKQWQDWTSENLQWGVRTDFKEPTKELLPFFHYTRIGMQEVYNEMVLIREKSPDYSFVWSEALDHRFQEFNAVLWCDAQDVMRGEISFSPITLRAAWLGGGDLTWVEIDGGVADYVRNKKSVLPFIYSLRQVRRDLMGRVGKAYELTVMENCRIIFWEEIGVPIL